MAGSAQQNVVSHWYQLFENFQTSALDFYTAVEAAVAARNLPDIETSRVTWKEGGVLSAKREYLRVSRGKLHFDICAAPYGDGHFFSWWLARTPGSLFPVLVLLALYNFLVLFIGGMMFQNSCSSILWMPIVYFGGLFLMGLLIKESDLMDEEEVSQRQFLARFISGYTTPAHTIGRTRRRCSRSRLGVLSWRSSIASEVTRDSKHLRQISGDHSSLALIGRGDGESG